MSALDTHDTALDTASRLDVVIVPVGNDFYAIPAEVVREVVADLRTTLLPTAPDVFLGVFNLRGEVVPLFDTAALLGVGRLREGRIAVVVSTTAGLAGLLVSGLPSVEVLDASLGPSELRGTTGTYAVHGGMAVLVDIVELLAVQRAPGVADTDGGTAPR
jgi:chemotaxis signal transduction protein